MFRKKYKSILVLSYALLLLNIRYPMIRFDTRVYNLTFTVILFLVPIVIFIRAFYVRNIILKLLGIVMSSIVAFFSVIFALLIMMNINFVLNDGYDKGFQCIYELSSADYRIKEYRIDGGATTSYSILVRQEKPLVLGLIIVKDIFFKYRSYEVDLKLEGSTLSIDNLQYVLKASVY